jgi:RecA/RadA recombinase
METIQKLKELQYYYSIEKISEITNIHHQTLLKSIKNNRFTKKLSQLIDIAFNHHCDSFGVFKSIPEIMDTSAKYVVDTPDGFQLIKNFITKNVQPCVRLTTSKGAMIECSSKHLIECIGDERWVFAGDLREQQVVTQLGPDFITLLEPIEDQVVYDFEVEHPEHRYWSGGFSNHNTGKSLFVLKILANAQKRGLIPVIFDTENAIDSVSAERIGLDPSKIKYVPCVTIEQTRNAIFKFLNSVKEKGLEGKFIIAIDSLGNLQSQQEMSRMEKESSSADMGSTARAMKSLMKTLTNLCGLTKTTAICTNHVYDDPSAMFPSLEKNMPGGRSVVYLPSVTVQLARKPVKADGGKTIDDELEAGQKNYSGVVLRALTVKNRFIRQYLEGEMYLSFTSGLDRYYGLLDLCVGFGIILQTGSTYTLADGTKLGFYKNFRKNVDLWEKTLLPELEKVIKEKWAYSQGEQIPDETEDVPDEE